MSVNNFEVSDIQIWVLEKRSLIESRCYQRGKQSSWVKHQLRPNSYHQRTKARFHRRRSKEPSHWPRAILTTHLLGNIFAEVLIQILSHVHSNECEFNGNGHRKLQLGDILVELDHGSENKAQFGDSLCSTLGGFATAVSQPKGRVELQNLS